MAAINSMSWPSAVNIGVNMGGPALSPSPPSILSNASRSPPKDNANGSKSPPSNSQQQQQQHDPTHAASLYKTELCRSFSETGFCRYGLKCQFAHGLLELRPVQRHKKYKTEPCKNFMRDGHCPYGPRCRFIHRSRNEADPLVVLAHARSQGPEIDNDVPSEGAMTTPSSRTSATVSSIPLGVAAEFRETTESMSRSQSTPNGSMSRLSQVNNGEIDYSSGFNSSVLTPPVKGRTSSFSREILSGDMNSSVPPEFNLGASHESELDIQAEIEKDYVLQIQNQRQEEADQRSAVTKVSYEFSQLGMQSKRPTPSQPIMTPNSRAIQMQNNSNAWQRHGSNRSGSWSSNNLSFSPPSVEGTNIAQQGYHAAQSSPGSASLPNWGLGLGRETAVKIGSPGLSLMNPTSDPPMLGSESPSFGARNRRLPPVSPPLVASPGLTSFGQPKSIGVSDLFGLSRSAPFPSALALSSSMQNQPVARVPLSLSGNSNKGGMWTTVPSPAGPSYAPGSRAGTQPSSRALSQQEPLITTQAKQPTASAPSDEAITTEDINDKLVRLPIFSTLHRDVSPRDEVKIGTSSTDHSNLSSISSRSSSISDRTSLSFSSSHLSPQPISFATAGYNRGMVESGPD